MRALGAPEAAWLARCVCVQASWVLWVLAGARRALRGSHTPPAAGWPEIPTKALPAHALPPLARPLQRRAAARCAFAAVGFRPGASVRWWRARAWRGRERRVLNTRVALFGDLSSIVKAPSSKHVAHCSGLYSRTDDISIRILGVTGQPLGNTPRKVVPSSYKTSKTGHFLPRPLRPDSVSTP